MRLLRTSLERIRRKAAMKTSTTSNSSIYDIHSLKQSSLPQFLIRTAADQLLQGQVIALPTDTIYGLAACVQNNKSVESLYKIKGRAFVKPIAICLAEIQDIYTWAHVTVPKELLEQLLPGPVTLIFKRQEKLNPEFNPLTQLVGVRIPNHPFVREVCRATGEPIALTSANKSSSPSSLTVEEFEDLLPHLGAVFREKDSIPDPSRAGSTIVELCELRKFKVIREGCALDSTLNSLKSFGLTESSLCKYE
uniref:Threonylcarbamoyl-AMP synthase n=1 Tax=Lepeophtheirus salmonis TaxID=72036 RepID=A0A0K2TL02_LEPSM